VSRRGYFIMQQTGSHSSLLQPKHRLSARSAAPVRRLWTLDTGHLKSVPPPSRPALLHWNGRPFVHPSASHPVCLPAGGEWDGIRRPGFPPQLIHPIKSLLPQIQSLPLKDSQDRARMPPFRSSLIADPFIQKQRFP